MTKDEKLAIKCAYLDLKGAQEAYESLDMWVHNWEAHKQSIFDLENTFDFLTEDEK